VLKIGLAIVAVVIAGLLVAAAARPDSFRVVRSTTIKAPPERIFPLISDFQRWSAWSPYEKKDPAMKRSFDGPAAGKGAVYAWEGNKDVGKGRMQIADASAPSRVVLNLDFSEPFEAHNMVDFTLEPKGDATEVTWSMRGPMPFVSKLITLFIDMDRMVGGDFEAGLANLKALAEK
jgi:uncharacterized protein YndB with AHSA1/START domain